MTPFTITGAQIVVTGGRGFLGTHLVKKLEKMKPKEVITPSSKEFDLRDPQSSKTLFKGVDLVIHLAANVDGIGYNKQHPAELFYDNILLGVHTMHEAWRAGVKKFVAIGTICAYPKHTPVPFSENDLWKGYPEETNAPYGLAKKMQLVQAQAYREQYGWNAIYLLPVNLYGPGDNFNPDSSHVIPALIKKFVDAKTRGESSVSVWGTGNPTREFLFVEDAAEGIILAAQKYDKSDPVNLGSSHEISIRELATLIGKLVGFEGEIEFDSTKPDGQPRRKLNVTRAEKEFGFRAQTSFEDGLKKTVQWYLSQSQHN